MAAAAGQGPSLDQLVANGSWSEEVSSRSGEAHAGLLREEAGKRSSQSRTLYTSCKPTAATDASSLF